MRKFVVLIFMILMCFLFLMPGISFSGIVSGPDQMVGQDIITPMADSKVIALNYLYKGPDPSAAVVRTLISLDKSTQTNDMSNPEGGTVLKCPTLADLTIKY